MNKFKFIILWIVFLNPSIMLFSQKLSTDAFEFPVKPGTPEWKELKTSAEIRADLQIPDNILSNISTAGLVETCLNYPLIGDIICYNSYQQGFDAVFNNFNGYREMIKRPEVGSLLIEFCKNSNLKDINLIPNGETYPRIYNLLSVEMLLAQKVIIQGLDDDLKKDLCKLILSIMNGKKLSPDFGNLTMISSCLIISRTLLGLNDTNFINLINEIFNYAEKSGY